MKKKTKKTAKKAKTPAVDWYDVKQQILHADKDVLKRVVAICDGHTISAPEAFLEAGLPETVVAAFTRCHESSSDDPKGMIFRGGKVIPQTAGVYGLEVIECIADIFGVTTWKMGRGSAADHLREQLIERNFETAVKA